MIRDLRLSRSALFAAASLLPLEVEHINQGVNTAVLKVCAEVCLRWGERLYSQEAVRRFEGREDQIEA